MITTYILQILRSLLIKTRQRVKKFSKKIKSIHIKPQTNRLSIKDNSYDYIVAMSVLSGSKNILKLLNEFKRILNQMEK